MEVRIETINEKKLIGKHLKMTLGVNKTRGLWKDFMAGGKKIINKVSGDLFSIQVYDHSLDLETFDQDTPFEKWAAVEVADFKTIPDGFDTFTLKGGLYAVFIHKGAAATGPRTFRYIFGTWLPASEYSLDIRPHFEILGEKYKNDDPDSEEEIWIPVRPKDSIQKLTAV